MNNGGRWWKAYQTPGTDVCADGPDALRELVRQEINRGAETIKIFASAGHGQPNRTTRNMSRDEIAAIIDTAHERGAKVRAHVADKAMIMECIELGLDVVDHGDEVDAEVIAAMVEAGTFWVPSLIFLRSAARARPRREPRCAPRSSTTMSAPCCRRPRRPACAS